MTIFDGRTRPNPSTDDIEEGVNEIIATLTQSGWSEGDFTVVIHLSGKVDIAGLRNVVPHVTINKSSIKALVTKMLRNRVNGAQAAFKQFMDETYFHVTLSMGDNPFDPDNPRWRNENQQWDESRYYDIDTSDSRLGDIIKAGKKVMGR